MSLSTSLRFGACALLVVACSQAYTGTADAQRPKLQTMELVEEPGAGGKFEELLSKRDLSKFRGYQSEEIPECWTVEGKHLVFSGEGQGDIMTKETYQDFELQVDWQIQEGGNSGIMFWVNTGDPQPYMSGPEIQILDDEKHADGKSDKTSAGSLYGLYAATDKTLRKPGVFNKSKIIVENNKFTHYLNNKKVLEVDFGSEDWNTRVAESKFKDWQNFAKVREGHICFQNHGDPVRFRNIRIKKIERKEDQAEGSRKGLLGATMDVVREEDDNGDVTKNRGDRPSDIQDRDKSKRPRGPQNIRGPGNVPGVGNRGRGGRGGPPVTPPPKGSGGGGE